MNSTNNNNNINFHTPSFVCQGQTFELSCSNGGKYLSIYKNDFFEHEHDDNTTEETSDGDNCNFKHRVVARKGFPADVDGVHVFVLEQDQQGQHEDSRHQNTCWTGFTYTNDGLAGDGDDDDEEEEEEEEEEKDDDDDDDNDDEEELDADEEDDDEDEEDSNNAEDDADQEDTTGNNKIVGVLCSFETGHIACGGNDKVVKGIGCGVGWNGDQIVTILTISNNGTNKTLQVIANGKELLKCFDCSKEFENARRIFPMVGFKNVTDQHHVVKKYQEIKHSNKVVDGLIKAFLTNEATCELEKKKNQEFENALAQKDEIISQKDKLIQKLREELEQLKKESGARRKRE